MRQRRAFTVILATVLGLCLAKAHADSSPANETIAFDKANPATGYWVGRIKVAKMEPFIALEVSRDDAGAHAARLFLLELGSMNDQCEEISVDGGKLTVVKQLMGKPLQIVGTVSDDAQSLTGTVQKLTPAGAPDDKPAEEPTEFTLHRSLKASTLDTAQAFTGDLVIPGMGKLGMTLVFARTPGGSWVGSVDVPVQSILGMPLMNVTETDGQLRAVMPIVMNPAVIEATIDKQQDRLVGKFKQATFDLDLNLQRNSGYVSPSFARPQNPRKPYPYEAVELTVPTKAGFELAGTLTVPQGASAGAPAPCAVLISGSGQQDRDETLLGHKPFLVIADRLTRAGIAVFRYDDRGVGQSGGRDQLENATSKDFADDAAAVVEFLKTQPQIDPKRIGLIGHSEGGLIAPMVATQRDDVAFIVLLAGPGVTGREILELQGRLILKAEGQSDEDIEKFSAQQKKVLDLALSGASKEEITKTIEDIRDDAMAEVAPASQPQGESDKKSALEKEQVEAQAQAVNNAWMKYFLTYDPRPTLGKVKCPVLAVNGTLDLQVWHDQNLPEIEKALKASGADFTIKRYDNLNHLFQPAKTGGMSEYAASEITFDDAVISDVIAWIKAKMNSQ